MPAKPSVLLLSHLCVRPSLLNFCFKRFKHQLTQLLHALAFDPWVYQCRLFTGFHSGLHLKTDLLTCLAWTLGPGDCTDLGPVALSALAHLPPSRGKTRPVTCAQSSPGCE